jgi:predicted Zn-dependent protease
MDLPPADRAVVLSNLAWCDFLSAQDERLDEALQCSQEALAQLGWLPAVQSTRGAVLVWSDRASEALPLLLQSYQGAKAPSDRAAVACVLALAYASVGRREDAKNALEQARALDVTCPLLPRAEAAVA